MPDNAHEKDDKKVAELKADVSKSLHNLVNCHQAVWGYYELGEYRKAYIMCLECRSGYATIAAKMSQLDAMDSEG